MTGSAKYIPLGAVIFYILFGLGVSIYGPLEYFEYNYQPVVVYIAAFLVLFSIGYYSGVRFALPTANLMDFGTRKQIVFRIFKISCILSVLLMSYELANAALKGGVSLNILNSGQAYSDTYSEYVRNTGNYSLNFIIMSFGAVPLFITKIWGIYYFRDIGRPAQLMVIYVIALTIIIYTVGGGKQKQLGDLMIIVVALWAIKMAESNRLKLGMLLKIAGFGMLGLVLMLILLGIRYSAIGIDADTLNSNIHELIYFKDDGLVMQLLGDRVGFAVSMLSGYFGQGYYGLSLAMEQDFTWTAFAGSSYSISVILNQFFGLPFMVEQSYPYIVGANTNWAETKWHTVFSWLASDFTFPGTLILLAFVAFVFGRTWKESVETNNPFAILLFVLLSIGIVYIPANNQLMHSPGGLFLLIVVVFLYAIFHAEYNQVDSRK